MSEIKDTILLWLFDRLNNVLESLFSYSLKETFFNPRCNPKVVLGNRKTKKIEMGHCEVLDTDCEVHKRVDSLMEKERVKYPLMDLNVYKKMRLAFSGNLEETKAKNQVIEDYLENKKEEYDCRISSELMNERMKPFQIELFNNGRKGCGKLQVLITFLKGGENVYCNSAREEHDFEGENFPLNWERTLYYKNVMYPGADFDTYWFNYDEWNLDSPIGNDHQLEFEVPKLNARYSDKKSIPLFYIDSASATDIEFEWKIFEPTLASPNVGNLMIAII